MVSKPLTKAEKIAKVKEFIRYQNAYEEYEIDKLCKDEEPLPFEEWRRLKEC